ncbi:MAG: winged helix-turn-helix domain-containing protein [Actinomycetota bacterium]
MTISFADELVAKLAAERRVHGTADTYLLLGGASPEVAETIAVALERRDQFVAHERPDSRIELLAAPDHLQRTYAAARELGEFTSRDLADRLAITLPAANNRIKALAQAGVVTRKRHDPAHGGRQFLYQVQHAA